MSYRCRGCGYHGEEEMSDSCPNCDAVIDFLEPIYDDEDEDVCDGTGKDCDACEYGHLCDGKED